MLTKCDLREQARRLRQTISAEYRAQASLAAAEHFISSPFFQTYQRFACFLSSSQEIDCLPIIQTLWSAKKQVYVPAISTDSRDKNLNFILYNKNDVLQPNRYHILEPQHVTEIIAANALDVALIPLLAFDNEGNRLGTGGGFYDSTFAFLVNELHIKKPALIGLAYELQQVDAIPHGTFDIFLDGVVTEKDYHFLKKPY